MRTKKTARSFPAREADTKQKTGKPKEQELRRILRHFEETGNAIAHLGAPSRSRSGSVEAELARSLLAVTDRLRRAFRRGNRLFVFGNGGSAAAAQHLVSELVNRFRRERAALPALALTTDTSVLTSISNDQDFSRIFSRQLEALARPGDIALAITSSGNSPNILDALKTARSLGVTPLALLGKGGGRARRLTESAITIPFESVPLIQEIQLVIAHLIADLIEQDLPPNPKKKSPRATTPR